MAFSEELHADADIDFRAGIKFAERWIPIKEEELPEYDQILIKFDNNATCSAVYNKDNDGKLTIWWGGANAGLDQNKVTHWRPISHK